MPEERTEREPDPRILRELSALADGTLEPGRADKLRELIATTPELGERYERERRAVIALQSLSTDRAPTSLRLAIDAQRRRVPTRRGRVFSVGALASAAIAAILLVLLLPGGSPGAPAVSQAAALALRGPAMPAPALAPGDKLKQSVGEAYFPDWSPWFQWRAVGQRTDRLDGWLAVTVYYTHGSKLIAYTILAAPPLPRPGSRMLQLDGIQLQSFVSRGRLVVTWRRGGHTCILSGAGVTQSQLAVLAGWKAPGLE